jgi:integrase/recombinase XerD
MMRDSVKDKSYRATPLGLLVGRYIRWFRNEWGATASTIRDYEAVLARMALTLADKKPLDVTVEDLRDVIDLWADREPRTRAKVTSVIRAFWAWAEEQNFVSASPAARIRRPRARRKAISLLPTNIDARLLRQLTVTGKGQKSRVIPLRGRIMLAAEEYLLEELEGVGRQPEPDDYLLYPEKRTPRREVYEAQPKRRCASNTVHRWWYRQLEGAGLVGKGVRSGLNMHRARHTFAQDVRRAHPDIGAVQHLLGHSDPSTTAGIYGHYDQSDLERAMEAFAKAKRDDEEESESA